MNASSNIITRIRKLANQDFRINSPYGESILIFMKHNGVASINSTTESTKKITLSVHNGGNVPLRYIEREK